MNIFLSEFKQYLLDIGYKEYIADRYVRAVSIFLLWYHADINYIRPFHIKRFCQFLSIRNYLPETISEYRTSLSLLSTSLQNNTHKTTNTFPLRKKLHRDDEVSS